MKLMNRNLKRVFYCLYNNQTPIIDSDGYETGEMEITYSDPVEIRVSVSPASGYTNNQMFGNLENYDKIMITDKIDCPIDENSMLFVDTMPVYDEVTGDLMNVPDYVVNRVAKSLNHISYALSKVKQS